MTFPKWFYHNDILAFAEERLKRRVRRRPIGFFLLPKSFTLKEIHALYQQATGKTLDKRNFLKKFLKSDFGSNSFIFLAIRNTKIIKINCFVQLIYNSFKYKSISFNRFLELWI